MTSFLLRAPFGSGCPQCRRPLQLRQRVEYHDELYPLQDGLYCPPNRLRLWHTECAQQAALKDVL